MGALEDIFREDQARYARNEPKPYDAVLGGSTSNLMPSPSAGAAVLGTFHTRPLLGKLFTLFNAKAKPCNGKWMRLELTDEVALTRRRLAALEEDILVKVYAVTFEVTRPGEQPYQEKAWLQAGKLTYTTLDLYQTGNYGFSAEYQSQQIGDELKAIAYPALLEAAQKFSHC